MDTVDDFSVSDLHTCTPEQAKMFIKHPQHYLKILTQNIRSINCNFLSLQTLLQRLSLDCDILVLTECWLLCSSNHHIPNIENFNKYSTVKNLNQSDGVVVYVRSNLTVTCEELCFGGSATGLSIRMGSHIAILCIYRSPSTSNIDNFLSSLNNLIPTFSNVTTVAITGDINIDIKPMSLDVRSHDYLNTLAFHGFLPTHTLPTRGNNCLDHLLLKTTRSSVSLVFDTTLTDHCSSLLCISSKKSHGNIVRSITKIDFDAMDKTMATLDFTPIYSMSDSNVATDALVDLLTNAISENSSTKKVPSNKKILKPWITPGLLRCMRHRDRLHKRLKQSPNNITLEISYKRYRNFCNKILKKVKRQFDTQELDKAGNNSKVLWETIQRITSTQKQQHASSQLLSHSDTPSQSCNDLNKFFADMGKKLADNIINDHTSPILPCSHTNFSSSSFVLDHTDIDEIKSVIDSLRSSAATGWDGISPVVLKRYCNILAPVLNHIFNLCFETAMFPSALKKAIIHPVFKGGDGNSFNNYRPIAVLPALSKVLERLINKRLVDFFEKNNLFSSQQFGFRKNKSTCDAVHELTNFIVEKINSRKKVLAVFLDLAKAFDTVPISILLLKLERAGVRGLQLDLFKSYLTNRLQMVKIGDHFSDELPICYGVPQGSILGPTLFLIFLNDLCNLNITNAKIVSFADDTALTFFANSWSELQIIAQNGFNSAFNWLRSHALTLNTSKTKLMTFSISPTSQPDIPITLKAHSCNTTHLHLCQCSPITTVDNIKYLGITLDRYLNYKTHINLVTGRVRKLIYIFKTLRHVAKQSVIRNVYYALCQSIITYCISCWGGATKTALRPLEVSHRAILKVATFRPILFPTTELYKNLRVLNIRQHFILQTILLQHLKTPFINITKRRKDMICTVPQTQFKYTKRFFFYLGPCLYNKINASLYIYNLPLSKCKLALREFFLNKTYDETEKYLVTLT